MHHLFLGLVAARTASWLQVCVGPRGDASHDFKDQRKDAWLVTDTAGADWDVHSSVIYPVMALLSETF